MTFTHYKPPMLSLVVTGALTGIHCFLLASDAPGLSPTSPMRLLLLQYINVMMIYVFHTDWVQYAVDWLVVCDLNSKHCIFDWPKNGLFQLTAGCTTVRSNHVMPPPNPILDM